MNSVTIPAMPCPHCGYIVDRSTPASDQATIPKPGDITICFDCGEISEYTGDDGSVTAMSKLTPGQMFTVLMQFPALGRTCKLIKSRRKK
jgi:hypothetical protein